MRNDILPIQIRDDLIIYIQGIPFDLTANEASKISNVVNAMVLKKEIADGK